MIAPSFCFGAGTEVEVLRLSLSDRLRMTARGAGFCGVGEVVCDSSGVGEEFGGFDLAGG